MTKKSRQKFKYLEKEKAFKMKEKAFFIICKGLSLKRIKQFLWKVKVRLQKWGKTLKKEKGKRKMRKSQTTTIIFFLFLLFCIKKYTFC